MDVNLLSIAALLTLSGLYFLESALTRAPIESIPAHALRPARNAIEKAWRTEPLQVFMRQLLTVRQRRSDHWRRNPARL